MPRHFPELRCAYVAAVGALEGRRTIGWTYSVLVSAGVEHVTAIRAYEQMVEKENHSTMGTDPNRRLEQIQSVIYMLEAFDSAARSGDSKAGYSAAEEVCTSIPVFCPTCHTPCGALTMS